MSRVAYVNGQYLLHSDACVHIEDRGYQFADGVYEVIAVRGGALIDYDWHMDRLSNSLAELRIGLPMSCSALKVVFSETIIRNRFKTGILYVQITRGVAKREHRFPRNDVKPAIVVTARGTTPKPKHKSAEGVAVVSLPDIRWGRCDIKSIALLPNVLVKQAAQEKGAFEAWQVDAAGFVTEGGSTNAWIINIDGQLVTRPAENAILNGITRRRLIEIAKEQGINVQERPFTLEEAKMAKEAFITSTTSFVTAVVKIDDKILGDGRPGSQTMILQELYLAYMEQNDCYSDDAK